jgi:hypothetical protein
LDKWWKLDKKSNYLGAQAHYSWVVPSILIGNRWGWDIRGRSRYAALIM